jgi:hypothetical protein
MHRHAQSNSSISNTNTFCLVLHRRHYSEMSVSIVFVYKDRSESTRKLKSSAYNKDRLRQCLIKHKNFKV